MIGSSKGIIIRIVIYGSDTTVAMYLCLPYNVYRIFYRDLKVGQAHQDLVESKEDQ